MIPSDDRVNEAHRTLDRMETAAVALSEALGDLDAALASLRAALPQEEDRDGGD